MKTIDRKNFIWNMIGSIANSFTSLIYLIIVTRINGTSIAGIFTFGFSIALLFQTIANYSGRTFQVTNLDKGINDKDIIYNRLSTSLITLLVVIIYLLIKDYDMEKNIIITLFVIYRVYESILDSLYGTIQKNNELYKVGISFTLRAVLSVISFLIIDLLTKNIYYSILGILSINIIIFILYDLKNYKKYNIKSKFNITKNNILFKTGVFIFATTFLTQYMLNAPKYAINNYLLNEDQTIYGIISMPITFIVLCSSFIVQPFLVKMSNYVKNKEYSNLKNITLKMVGVISIIGVICIIIAYLLGIPVLEIIYGIKLTKYLYPLLILLFGGIFFCISCIISNSLIALRKTFCQMIFYAITSLIILILSNILVQNFNILGASLAYLISMFVLALLYYTYFIIILKKEIQRNEKV